MSWNVHGCVGRSGQFDPRGVLAVIERLSPDILALQELDSRQKSTGRFDTFEFFRESLGWNGAEARTIRDGDGDYGHALISRWQMSRVEILDLSVRRREPRMAVSSIVHGPGMDIRVTATHLGLRAAERKAQLLKLSRQVNLTSHEPAIVLGDFNEWRPRGIATRTLCPPFEIAAALPSYPSRRPFLALDRIWCRAPLEPVAVRVDTSAKELSDHLPVLAELKLRR